MSAFEEARRKACREFPPQDAASSGTQRHSNPGELRSSTTQVCRRRCRSGRQTKTPSTRREQEKSETTKRDRENTDGHFARSTETSAHRDTSCGAPPPCRREGPPKKPCNTLRGSSSTSHGIRLGP